VRIYTQNKNTTRGGFVAKVGELLVVMP